MTPQEEKEVKKAMHQLELIRSNLNALLNPDPLPVSAPKQPVTPYRARTGRYNMVAVRELLLNGFSESELKSLTVYNEPFKGLRSSVADLAPVIVTSDKWQDIKKGSNGWLACDHKVDDGYNILVSCGDDWVLAWLTADEFDIVHKEDKV